jgi:hypothetical protein
MGVYEINRILRRLRGLRRGGFVLVCLSSSLCFAADLADIHGIVRTGDGVPIANARVTATAVGANAEHDAITDQRGLYRLEGIAAGSWNLSSASAETRCDVKSGQDSQCDIIVANGGIIDSETVRDLPVNGRDVQQATTLQAGVSAVETQQSTSDTNSGRGQRGFGQQITLAGARPQQNNYLLDGITTNDYANSSPGSVLGLSLGADAVQQLAVNTSSYPAQFGRSSGGVVHAVTRAGSNAFHGSVYEFLRNSALDARAYFDSVKPPLSKKPIRRRSVRARLAKPYIHLRELRRIEAVAGTHPDRHGAVHRHARGSAVVDGPFSGLVSSAEQRAASRRRDRDLSLLGAARDQRGLFHKPRRSHHRR